jgi:hypothetical protein
MKIALLPFLAAAALLTFSPSRAFSETQKTPADESVKANQPEPIHFEKGVTSVKVQGALTPKRKQAVYTFKAKKGEKLLVKIVPGKGLATSGHLKFPSGKEDGMPGGVIFDGILDESGDYLLTVTPHHMAEDSNYGNFVLELTIK